MKLCFSVTASHTKLILKQGLTGQLDKKGDLGLPRNREISSKDPAGLNTQMVEHSDGAQGLQDTLSGFVMPLGRPKREFKSIETSLQPSPCLPPKTEVQGQRAQQAAAESIYSLSRKSILQPPNHHL